MKEQIEQSYLKQFVSKYWGGPDFTWSEFAAAVEIIRRDEHLHDQGLIPAQRYDLGDAVSDLLQYGWKLEGKIQFNEDRGIPSD